MQRFADAPATYAIALLTVVASAAILLFWNIDVAAVADGFIPARVPGIDISGLDVPVAPVWLTPLTATLLHGGWIHLLFNMVMLVYCGRAAEKAVGPMGIAILYIVGAYAAALGQWAQGPASATPMIGASGAISAIIATYALLYGEVRTRALGPIPARLLHALWLAAAWIAITVLIDYAMAEGTHVAIGAHIGGFLVGLILARPLLLWHYRHA
jgi:membrane associated rhomboid family serine protease